MEPTFFGDENNPLFGVYHPPLSQSSKSNAVLICYPLFQEYIRSHRALRYLADQLSKAGCHVFRFDYFATGDSSGELKEASISKWQESIRLAENELKDLSGMRNITIIGLRFGALLATQHNSPDIRNLILWDPLINGETYISDLKSKHEAMLIDPDRYLKPRKDERNDSAIELLGYSISNELNEQIQQIDIHNITNLKIDNLQLFFSNETSNKYIKLCEDLKSAGVSFECFNFTTNSDWDDLNKLEDTLMPYEIMNKITELLT